MSADPRAPIVSATSALIGVGTTLMTTVAAHVGPLSAQSLTKRGAALMDEAQVVLDKKDRKDIEEGSEDYIIPDPQRTAFWNNQINPLHAERERLIAETQTFRGSVVNWNSSRVFYQKAHSKLRAAQALSSRSLTECRLKSQNTAPEDHGEEEQLLNDIERAQQESQATHAYPPINYEQSRNRGQNLPDHRGRRESTASSQQSFSTARADSLGTLEQYTSQTLYQSPTNIEGPSFANFQGYYSDAQISNVRDSHQSTSSKATKQYAMSSARK